MDTTAVTVIGHDRPGIIAEATAILADLGLNLEDSTMTLLRGHFAMMLICEGDASADEIEARLAPLAADGALTVSARSVPAEAEEAQRGASYLLSVHGGDRPGIVSEVTKVLAAVGGNVTDLTTRLAGDLYVLLAEVDLPADADVATLSDELKRVGAAVGVDVTLNRQEPDVL